MEEARPVGREIGLGRAVPVEAVVPRVEDRVPEYKDHGHVVRQGREARRDQEEERDERRWPLHVFRNVSLS